MLEDGVVGSNQVAECMWLKIIMFIVNELNESTNYNMSQ